MGWGCERSFEVEHAIDATLSVGWGGVQGFKSYWLGSFPFRANVSSTWLAHLPRAGGRMATCGNSPHPALGFEVHGGDR